MGSKNQLITPDLIVANIPLSLQEPEVFSLNVINCSYPVILSSFSLVDLFRLIFFSKKNPLLSTSFLYTCDWTIRKIGLWKIRRNLHGSAVVLPSINITEISYLCNLLLSLGENTVTLVGFEERIAKKFQLLLERIQCGVTLRGCIDPRFMKYRMDDVILFLQKVNPKAVILSHKIDQKQLFFDSILQGKVVKGIFFNVSSSIYSLLDNPKKSFFKQITSSIGKIFFSPITFCWFIFCSLCCVIMLRCPLQTDDGASHA